MSDSFKNWRMILFFSILDAYSIGHSADRKIFKITKLNKEVNTLNSISVSSKVNLMSIKMESKVTSRLKDNGLSSSKYPPIKLIIKD